MKRKISAKLSLHRETLHQLEGSGLRGVAGASGQIDCDNTLGFSCRNPCGTIILTQANFCRPTCNPNCTITVNPTTTTNPPTETA